MVRNTVQSGELHIITIVSVVGEIFALTEGKIILLVDLGSNIIFHRTKQLQMTGDAYDTYCSNSNVATILYLID